MGFRTLNSHSLIIMDMQVPPVPNQPKTFRFPQRTFGVRKKKKKKKKKKKEEVSNLLGSTVGRGYIMTSRKISRFVIFVCWLIGTER